MKQERRFFESKPEIRSGENSRLVEGYALLFDVESRDLGGFTEIIKKGALDKTNMNEVVARTNHDNALLLAKTPKSLKLEVDDRGLKYSFEAPNTTAGNDLLEQIQREIITQSSFAFSGVTDKWIEKDKSSLREIEHISKIWDVSPVSQPAYEDTTVAKRSLEEFKESQVVITNQNRIKQIELIKKRNRINS